MKAKDLIKKERPIEKLYASIQEANDRGEHRIIITFFSYVSDETKLRLMADGFKVYAGGFNAMDLIVEW